MTSGCSELTGIWGWHLQSTVYRFACVTLATFDPPSQRAVLCSRERLSPPELRYSTCMELLLHHQILEHEMAALNFRKPYWKNSLHTSFPYFVRMWGPAELKILSASQQKKKIMEGPKPLLNHPPVFSFLAFKCGTVFWRKVLFYFAERISLQRGGRDLGVQLHPIPSITPAGDNLTSPGFYREKLLFQNSPSQLNSRRLNQIPGAV